MESESLELKNKALIVFKAPGWFSCTLRAGLTVSSVLVVTGSGPHCICPGPPHWRQLGGLGGAGLWPLETVNSEPKIS